MTIKKNKKIKFIKPVLNKLSWTGKREWYSALNQEALCIQVNKHSKAYYAQFATIKITDGKRKTVGHKKFLAHYSTPLEIVKAKLRNKIDEWKKAAKADVESLNVAALVRNFIKHGSNVTTIYDPVRDSKALMQQGQKMLSGGCTLGVDC